MFKRCHSATVDRALAAEAELARLREQTRWRDVVTEPPPAEPMVLWAQPGTGFVALSLKPTRGHWLPCPPAPPEGK